MGQMQGGYGGGQSMSPQMPIETVDMLIPQNKVGLIIGTFYITCARNPTL